MAEEVDFGVGRSKAGGRRSYCRACDRQRREAYDATHRQELSAQRKAVREAAREAELEALAVEHKKRVEAAKKLHAAQVRRQKEFLRSIGVPKEPGGGHRESPPTGPARATTRVRPEPLAT
jgi:hypothetical protein